jgi:hypothetical protein
MKGFPKHLNTRADYEYVRDNFPASLWQPVWQRLLDERYCWQISDTLADGDEGIEDATHRVQVEENDGTGVTPRYQMELVEDVNAALFRLGFTVAEVSDALV